MALRPGNPRGGRSWAPRTPGLSAPHPGLSGPHPGLGAEVGNLRGKVQPGEVERE